MAAYGELFLLYAVECDIRSASLIFHGDSLRRREDA